MQFWIRKLTGNHYVLPLIVFLICIWRIFTPQLTSHDGLGWDGHRYYLLTLDGLQSDQLDAYMVLRIFPCMLIHIILQSLGVVFAPASVILAFKLMNTVLIALSAWLVKKIFEQYNLSPVSQLAGFVLVFMNYGVLNFTFYYPIMTDTPAFFLSVALFYFFCRGELINIMLVGFIGAFTWPVLLPMAIALILFPAKKIEFVPLPNIWTGVICSLSAAYALFTGWYLIFYKGETSSFEYALPISRGMLPVTFITVGIMFFFLPFVLRNQKFFSLQYYRSQLNPKSIFLVLVLIAAFLGLRYSIKTGSSEFLTPYHQLKIHMLYGFQRPFITIVSHFNYFGCAMLLAVLFWRKFSAYISTFGLGIAGCIFFNLFVFFVKPESRAIVHFIPWLLILMSLFIGQYKFSPLFYILIFIINVVAAKLWLFFEYSDFLNHVMPDGTVDFPDQWFYMHLGIWMKESVWLWIGIAFFISMLLFIFSLYKIEPGQKAFLFYKKFERV
ncbi:MAG: hypothetical protein JWO06_3969 [Bacteroidota bacterium]|nr:hypothetical protein [Bacteroidota bacterium]